MQRPRALAPLATSFFASIADLFVIPASSKRSGGRRAARLALGAVVVSAVFTLAGCGDKKPSSIIPKDEDAKALEEKCADADAACKQIKERMELVRGCSSDSHCVVVPDSTRCGCFGGCAQVANIGGSDKAIEMMHQAAQTCDVSSCPRPKSTTCKEPQPKCVEGTCIDANNPPPPKGEVVPVE
jgi:predicted small lipoprotein YifL